jgi:hypothetical protein
MTRGERLEGLMTTVFLTLREAEELTESKIDLEFMLSIVGSYIVAIEQGKLETEFKTPSAIFDERIFPIVDNSTLEVEEIEDGE